MNALRRLSIAILMAMLVIGASSTSISERSERDYLREALRQQDDEGYEPAIDERENEDGTSQDSNECSTCPLGTECCQLDGATFACCSKIYLGNKEKVSFDREKNLAIYNLPDGSIHIADFNKGLLIRFDKPAKKCFIAPGLDYTMDDVIAVVEGKTRDNKASKLTYFEESDAKPIEDHSLVPDVLQDSCKDVPLSWHEKILNADAKSTRDMETIGLERRGWGSAWKKVKTVVVNTAVNYAVGALIGK